MDDDASYSKDVMPVVVRRSLSPGAEYTCDAGICERMYTFIGQDGCQQSERV